MSKDVFKDLGFDEKTSAEMKLRTTLMDAVLKIIERHKYTQTELMALFDQKQPHVSSLMRGKIAQFSSEKLFQFLTALDANVQVKVSIPRRKVSVA